MGVGGSVEVRFCRFPFRVATTHAKEERAMFGTTRVKPHSWFINFCIYGPEQPAFDGSAKPGDSDEVR
jgi:hypothetical protein